ncbi:MAG: SGNH/GDSL hydrolase family protein [Bdellovibrionales bacterium]|nr:SGNH/GDSL hydrolase family protein [Bdellovibrionales bacterium]
MRKFSRIHLIPFFLLATALIFLLANLPFYFLLDRNAQIFPFMDLSNSKAEKYWKEAYARTGKKFPWTYGAEYPPNESLIENPGRNIHFSEQLLKPNETFRERQIGRITGRVITDTTYSADALGRRKTPGPKKTPRATVLMLGDSLTFGHAVQDHETASAFLAERFPDLRVLNFGIGGAGLNDILDLFLGPRGTEVLSDIKGPAIVILNLIDHDWLRGVCATRHFSVDRNWMLKKNKYEVQSSGQLVRVGTIGDRCPFYNVANELLSWPVFRFYKVQLDEFQWGNGKKNSLAMLSALIQQLKKSIQVEKAVVSLVPWYSSRIGMDFEKDLATVGFETWDFSDVVFDHLIKNPRIPVDHHFTPESQFIYSLMLGEKLEK